MLIYKKNLKHQAILVLLTNMPPKDSIVYKLGSFKASFLERVSFLDRRFTNKSVRVLIRRFLSSPVRLVSQKP